MKPRGLWLWCVAGPAAAVAACAGATPPEGTSSVARGQAYFTTCAGCHGNVAEGLAGMSAPRLAGLDEVYIARQLDLYRTGLRGGGDDLLGMQMNGRAEALPDAQALAEVAAYISTLPRPSAPATRIDQASMVRGAELYASCAACHGERGEGKSALQAPPLSGTDARYLARQLANFRSGVRGRDGDAAGQQMRAAAAVLPDDAAIAAVSAYASSLKG